MIDKLKRADDKSSSFTVSNLVAITPSCLAVQWLEPVELIDIAFTKHKKSTSYFCDTTSMTVLPIDGFADLRPSSYIC
jgi:hypothetical protein